MGLRRSRHNDLYVADLLDRDRIAWWALAQAIRLTTPLSLANGPAPSPPVPTRRLWLVWRLG